MPVWWKREHPLPTVVTSQVSRGEAGGGETWPPLAGGGVVPVSHYVMMKPILGCLASWGFKPKASCLILGEY